MTFLGIFWASHGRIWVKIGGNQAEAFPDLPIQPRNLDFDRKTTKNSQRNFEKKSSMCFSSYFFI